MSVAIQPATLRDACFIAANMRQADRREIEAVFQFDQPAQIAAALLHVSGDLAFTASIKGQPVACFGVALTFPHCGTAWAYGTDRLPRVAPAITRYCLTTLGPELRHRGVHRVEIRSIVDHDISHRWLESMGAVREGVAQCYGRNREPFVQYAFYA